MQSALTREYRKMYRNLNGMRTMNRLPECLVVIDPRKEKNAVREARKMGITTVALIDTDCDPDEVDLPIPGNDDSIRSIELMVQLLADAVLAGKGGGGRVEAGAGGRRDAGRVRRPRRQLPGRIVEGPHRLSILGVPTRPPGEGWGEGISRETLATGITQSPRLPLTLGATSGRLQRQREVLYEIPDNKHKTGVPFMPEITAQAVKDLREQTGLPMMDCKRALQRPAATREKAVELLRKEGKKTMEKRAGRSTSSGRIAVYADMTGGVGAMIDLRCESAPVATNDQFVQLANDLARQLATGPARPAPEELLAQSRPASRATPSGSSSTT